MATRQRHIVSATPARRSGVQQVTPAASRTGPINTELPPYEPPTYPLNARAQDALNKLHNTQSLAKVRKHYDAATKNITDSAGQINDLLHERDSRLKRRKKRHEEQDNEMDEDDEQTKQYEAFNEKVDSATKKLEESMRSVIDGKQGVDRIDEAVGWLKGNAVASTQQELQSQMTQRAQSQRRRRRGQEGEDEDGDEEMPDAEEDDRPSPGPTPLNNQDIALTGPSEHFSKRITSAKDKYTSLSLATRYSTNNDYIGFKGIVHDAHHPGEEVPLPKASTWFTESGAPAPGITSTTNADDEGSDDDIAIAREKISTRCPITFQEFKDPVTSSKCPHSFEREAIMGMIKQSSAVIGVGGRRGEKAVQCPVSGCSHMLSAPDLRVDHMLVRKIRRIQMSREEDSEEEDDEEEEERTNKGKGRADAGVGRDVGWGFDGIDEKTPQASQRPPRSSVVLDLGGSDEDDDE